MSNWLIRWLQHRPRRGLWLALWMQAFVSVCLISLGTVPYTLLTLIVILAFAIWYWSKLLPDDVDRDDGGHAGEQGPDQRAM